MRKESNLQTQAIALTALILPVATLSGILVGAIYKTINPKDVDISSDLAYLREGLVAGFGMAALLFGVVVWLLVRIYKKHRAFSVIQTPLSILVLVLSFLLGSLALHSYTESLENEYRCEHSTECK